MDKTFELSGRYLARIFARFWERSFNIVSKSFKGFHVGFIWSTHLEWLSSALSDEAFAEEVIEIRQSERAWV
jgi:hypothetical protein